MVHAMNAKGFPATVPPPAKLKLLDSDPGAFSIFVWSNVTVVCWPVPASEQAVRRVESATDALLATGLPSFSNIHIVTESAGVPSESAREGLVKMADRYASSLACVGVALLGSGFWASARASSVTGMRMRSPQSAAFKVDASLDAIADWLPPHHQERTGITLRPKHLRAAMAEALERATATGSPE
jgi:hypothetical protein